MNTPKQEKEQQTEPPKHYAKKTTKDINPDKKVSQPHYVDPHGETRSNLDKRFKQEGSNPEKFVQFKTKHLNRTTPQKRPR